MKWLRDLIVAGAGVAAALWLVAQLPHTWVEWFLIAVVHVGCIPAVGYPLVWRFARPAWAGSRVGRALMRKAEALALLFVVSVANVWMPGRWWVPVYTVVLTYVVVTLWRQFCVLVHVLREGRVHGVSD